MSIKVAVIGAGVMGQNHARIYSELPNVNLVGIADVFIENAQKATRRYGGEAFSDYSVMLDTVKPDAVTIAVPTEDHVTVALEVAKRKTHILVEKPIALNIEEARSIITACESQGVFLAVGHVERFNPAVIELKRRLMDNELGRVFQIDTRRQSPFPSRVRDVGVIIDLAVHDIDVIRYVTGSEFSHVFAETQRQIHSSHEDLVSALFRLDHNIVGTMAVNWLTPSKVRELRVIGERGMFHVDYLTQDLFFYENGTTVGEWDTLRQLRGVSEGRMIRHIVAKREPLRAELESFITAVQERDQSKIHVNGLDGLKSVEIAQAIIHSGRQQQVVFLK
ncbi:MAG: Gfo/Idh/MocA family oxidoreductase [Anaerolineae bacterium]|nr:Gfo/Idh/MocA family oxidoreductase [Anaerolineae bacterium]